LPHAHFIIWYSHSHREWYLTHTRARTNARCLTCWIGASRPTPACASLRPRPCTIPSSAVSAPRPSPRCRAQVSVSRRLAKGDRKGVVCTCVYKKNPTLLTNVQQFLHLRRATLNVQANSSIRDWSLVNCHKTTQKPGFLIPGLSGLVVTLLHAEVPVLWAIGSDKTASTSGRAPRPSTSPWVSGQRPQHHSTSSSASPPPSSLFPSLVRRAFGVSSAHQ
jgi:hypothetical protein